MGYRSRYLLIFAFLWFLPFSEKCCAATEDFTTYTEYDPSSKITKTSSKVSTSVLRQHYGGYVYKDYGANYFDNFTHEWTFKVTSIDDPSEWGVYALGNVANADHDDMSGALSLRLTSSFFYGNNLVFGILGSGTYDYFAPTLGTTYYLTLQRTDSTLTLEIYSDSSRTTLLDTLSVDHDSSLFRYLYVVLSDQTTSDFDAVTYFVENLELTTDSSGAPRRVIIIP